MHLVMTPTEWDSALASARSDNEDALDVRYTESGGRYLLVTHRHWQQRIPIVIGPATPPARGSLMPFTHKSADNINREREIRVRGKWLAEHTDTAYSYGRYRSWTALATALLRHGYTEREAEAILRSKWTRWAADSLGDRYGHTTASKAAPYIIKHLTPAHLKELVDGTFGVSDAGESPTL